MQAWKDRDNASGWKFKKATQAYIFGAMWRSDVVRCSPPGLPPQQPRSSSLPCSRRCVCRGSQIAKAEFAIALQYLQGLQGAGRKRLLQQAAHIIKQCDVPSTALSGTALVARVTRNKLKRAVMVLDALTK